LAFKPFASDRAVLSTSLTPELALKFSLMPDQMS